MTDTTCFVAQPASGDSIQFLKAGIMEIPDVLVVNKEDIGAAARKTLSELRTTVRRRRADAETWAVPVLSASAARGTGIERLADTLEAHRGWLKDSGRLKLRRNGFQAEWIVKRLREQFGQFGIERLGGEARLMASITQRTDSPYDRYADFRDQLLSHWR
jgi:LAO/AO transport system kinase